MKKPASVPDEAYADRAPLTGRKRPVRERLGSNPDSRSNYDNQGNLKRLESFKALSSL